MNEGSPISTKLAILSDGFFEVDIFDSKYGVDFANILLERAVSRLNRLVKPQITIILGDFFKDVQAIFDKLDSPHIRIPSNFNCDSEILDQNFYCLEPMFDIHGIRIVSFSEESPIHEYQKKLHAARSSYHGAIISIQHSSPLISSPQKSKIISTMKETGVLLSISSHQEKKLLSVKHKNITFANVPGFYNPPFPFTVININNGQIQIEEQMLALDEKLNLSDNHIHTHLAYCNDNIIVDKAIAVAGEFGLSGMSFAEHSGQLYFGKKRYWDKSCLIAGMNAAGKENNRMGDYLRLKQAYQQPSVRFGLEVDCDYNGKLLLKKSDRSDFDFIIGAMHGLPGINRDIAPCKKDAVDFIYILEKLLAQDIDVLAHPFRIFRRSGWKAPEELFPLVANLLRQYDTAAEINFHTNEPPVEFIRICLNQGVKFSLGSDAHHMAEIGDFAYHLSLLKEAGFDGDLSDILIPFSRQ